MVRLFGQLTCKSDRLTPYYGSLIQELLLKTSPRSRSLQVLHSEGRKQQQDCSHRNYP